MKAVNFPLEKEQITALFQQGLLLHQQNKLQEAQAIYKKILVKQPHHFDALALLGLIAGQTRQYTVAIEFLSKALQINAKHAETYFNRGIALKELGRFDEALVDYDHSIRINPNYFMVYSNRGNVLQELKRYDEALVSYELAISIKPDYAEAYYNRGIVLKELKRFDEALVSYGLALGMNPNFAQAFNNQGLVLHELRQFDEAIASYDRAIGIKSDYLEAYNNRGNALLEVKNFDAAIISYDLAIGIKPDYAEAYYNRGNALRELRHFDAAISSYDLAIRIKPDYAEAYYNRGIVLRELNRLDEAFASYDLAIRIDPEHAKAYNNQGLVLQEGRFCEDALIRFEQAIRIKSNFAEAYFNRGNVLKTLRRFDEALICINQAINLKPDLDFLKGYKQHLQMIMVDWCDWENQKEIIVEKIKKNKKVVSPFEIIALIDDPAIHRLGTELYIEKLYPPNNILGPIIKDREKKKIRLGFYSADFRFHAVSILIAELIEILNKDKFEKIAFYFGPDVQDEMQNRLSKSFDQFLDIRNKSDQEVAVLSRQLGIDIAIDLGGYTADSRMGIFSYRAAPVQVSYLGYLGTSGTKYIDYLLADKILIPPESQKHYSEKIIYLSSYQVNDRKRAIANKKFTKSELRLPEDGFIFCCFNNNYKITPTAFDSWMFILKSVEGSVLFLYAENKWAKSNLINEALKRGIPSERLVFGEHLEADEYLARYQICDLFLDTFPYNAGTTASDALWAGLPVLTKIGASFASRVAASLLTAIDLPELITNTQEHYEALAIELATNPAKLKALKDKLEGNRLNTLLFDTPNFSKQIEGAFTTAMERYLLKLPADHIYMENNRI